MLLYISSKTIKFPQNIALVTSQVLIYFHYYSVLIHFQNFSAVLTAEIYETNIIIIVLQVGICLS